MDEKALYGQQRSQSSSEARTTSLNPQINDDSRKNVPSVENLHSLLMHQPAKSNLCESELSEADVSGVESENFCLINNTSSKHLQIQKNPCRQYQMTLRPATMTYLKQNLSLKTPRKNFQTVVLFPISHCRWSQCHLIARMKQAS